MAHHSKGPWKVEQPPRKRQPTLYEHKQKAIIRANGATIATVEGPSNLDCLFEWGANVRLMAAAPDLYDACRDALRLLEKLQKHGDIIGFENMTITAISAALANVHRTNA